MSKSDSLSCNIIKDLLPSYLEGLCTQDTRIAVETHLSECSACKKLAGAMQQTDFISERMETEEINYMKKVKRHFIKKGSGSIALIAFLIFGVITSMSSYRQRPIELYYVFLPFLLAVTKLLFPSRLLKPNAKRRQNIAVAIGMMLTCYAVFITLFVIFPQGWLLQGYGFFGIKPENIGPILHRQFYVILLYHTAMYAYGIYRAMYGRPASFFHMSIYLACGFIILSEDHFLKSLTSPSKAYSVLLQPICIFLLEWAAINGILFIREKKSCR